MKAHFSLTLMASLLLTTGCDRLGHNANRMGETMRESYDNTRYRMSQYLYNTERMPAPPVPYSPPTAFCYEVLMDIICYDRPRPELHLTLVAVQGEHSYAYQDFMPMPAGEAQDRFYDAVYENADQSGAYAESSLGQSGTIVTHSNGYYKGDAIIEDVFVPGEYEASGETSTIIVKDLGGEVASDPSAGGNAPKVLLNR
jgi:hypothetical protein